MSFLAGFFRGSGVPQGDMMRSVKFTAANRTSLQTSMMALRFVTWCIVCGMYDVTPLVFMMTLGMITAAASSAVVGSCWAGQAVSFVHVVVME